MKPLRSLFVVLLLAVACLASNIGSSGQISVTSSATLIIAASSGVSSRQAVLIKNTSTSTPVYIGTQSVTTSTGQYLGAGETITIPATCAVYGIVTTGSVTVTYLELIQ